MFLFCYHLGTIYYSMVFFKLSDFLPRKDCKTLMLEKNNNTKNASFTLYLYYVLFSNQCFFQLKTFSKKSK